jgi:hypothetical protein
MGCLWSEKIEKKFDFLLTFNIGVDEVEEVRGKKGVIVIRLMQLA